MHWSTLATPQNIDVTLSALAHVHALGGACHLAGYLIMGFDCTLHIIDETRIRERFVDRLLNPTLSGDPFDQRIDSAELWTKVRSSLEGESPKNSASMVAQLSLLFAAAEQPYHSERGFCLSLWADGPDGCEADVPKRFIGNPEDLFTRLVAQSPQLRGCFPTMIESNFSTGIYVPSEKVPALLKWAKKTIVGSEVDGEPLFRGLLLVLEQAADQKLAYWEATDLPLEMRTIRPTVRTPGLKQWEYPSLGYAKTLGMIDGRLFVSAMSEERGTLAIDLRFWPPKYVLIPEYSLSVARSAQGNWLFVSADNVEHYNYRPRVRTTDLDAAASVLRPAVPQSENGFESGGFLGERVMAFARFQKGISPLRVPLIESDGTLIDTQGAAPLMDDHSQHQGAAFPDSACVVRLQDGRDVLLWNGDGYSLSDDKTLTPIFPAIGHVDSHCSCAVPWGPDGFIFIRYSKAAGRELIFVRDGEPPVAAAPKIENPMQLFNGPGESLLVWQGGWKAKHCGVIWFPNEKTFIKLDKAVFADEDPTEIRALFFSETTGRLIATTPHRLWATAIAPLLSRSRHSALTGRLVK